MNERGIDVIDTPLDFCGYYSAIAARPVRKLRYNLFSLLFSGDSDSLSGVSSACYTEWESMQPHNA